MVHHTIFISIFCYIFVSKANQIITTDSGLQIEEIKRTDNCESKAEIGSLLSVHYTGYFVNGTKFDSSYDRNEHFTLILGKCPTTLIRGWVEGLQGMCDGEKRRLTIPPQLGYGEKGKGKIPGNSTLHFDVELTKLYEIPSEEELQEIREKFGC